MDILERVKRLCYMDISEEELNPEQTKLYHAAKAFLDADEATAELLAKELYTGAQEARIKDIAVSLLFALLLWQGRFDEMAAYGLPRNDDDAEQIAVYDTRDSDIIYSSNQSEHDMPDFPLVQPIITVEINGVDIDLIIDTGALITTISQSVAERCGVAVSGTTAEADGAAGNSFQVQLASISEIKVGNLIYTNKQCIIIPDAALYFSDINDGLQMNGTIGWEIIKLLRWEIDYKNRRVCLQKPQPEDVVKNMCCDFFPMTKITLDNSAEITVGLDTGATYSFFGKEAVDMFPNAIESKRTSGGAGATDGVEEAGYPLPGLRFYHGNAEVKLDNAFMYKDRGYSFAKTFITPGTLGSDIASNRVLVLDYGNRRLDLK